MCNPVLSALLARGMSRRRFPETTSNVQAVKAERQDNECHAFFDPVEGQSAGGLAAVVGLEFATDSPLRNRDSNRRYRMPLRQTKSAVAAARSDPKGGERFGLSAISV